MAVALLFGDPMWLYYYAAKAAVGKVESCVRSDACSKDVSLTHPFRRWSDALKTKNSQSMLQNKFIEVGYV